MHWTNLYRCICSFVLSTLTTLKILHQCILNDGCIVRVTWSLRASRIVQLFYPRACASVSTSCQFTVLCVLIIEEVSRRASVCLSVCLLTRWRVTDFCCVVRHDFEPKFAILLYMYRVLFVYNVKCGVFLMALYRRTTAYDWGARGERGLWPRNSVIYNGYTPVSVTFVNPLPSPSWRAP